MPANKHCTVWSAINKSAKTTPRNDWTPKLQIVFKEEERRTNVRSKYMKTFWRIPWINEMYYKVCTELDPASIEHLQNIFTLLDSTRVKHNLPFNIFHFKLTMWLTNIHQKNINIILFVELTKYFTDLIQFLDADNSCLRVINTSDRLL